MSTPEKSLTGRQEAFVDMTVEEGGTREAAKKLSLTVEDISRLETSKPLRRAVAGRLRNRLQTDGAAKAIKTMIALMDEKYPPAVRLNAAVKVAELAGIRPPDPGDLGETMEGMTGAELEAIVAACNVASDRLGDAARPVSSLIQGVAQRSADHPPADEPEPGTISEG